MEEKYYGCVLVRKDRFFVRKNGKNQYITTDALINAKVYSCPEEIPIDLYGWNMYEIKCSVEEKQW